MSTVKISQLSEITHLNSNTSNTLIVGVDIPTGVTGKITATTLAHSLYSHNSLNVGNNEILFPDTIGQFSGNSSGYLQVNLQNFDANGTADYIVTADKGNDITSYIDLGITNSEYDNSNPVNGLGTSIDRLSGYLYVKGNTAGGNLVMGVIDPNREIRFISGGLNSENVVYKISNTGITLLNNSNIVFSDSSVQTVASAPANYTQSAFDKANTVNAYAYSANTWLQSNTGSALAAAKVYTDTANSYIQSHYLANNTGTFNGSLTFTGNVNANGFINLINPNITDNTVFLKITGAAGGYAQPPSNPGYTIHTTSIDGQGNRIVADAFGAVANNYASFIGRRGRGTAQSPSAVQNGDVIARFAGNGFGSTKFSQYGDGRIEVVANENFTDTSKKTKIDFYTTEAGSNTANVIATFNGSDATFAGVVRPQKGFIYTPNVISSNVTTIGIDIANNSLYKLSCNNDLSISLSEFQYGKVVEVWLTNYSGSNRTVTHGCSAINASVNSTTFTIPATSSAYLRYFSIDGDLANTYVTINHG